MFGKFFGKGRAADQYDKSAVEALHELDAVIRQVHPDRFPDDLDAMPYVNPPRIAMNAFLGRPDTERFFPLDYDALVERLVHFANKNLLDDALKLSMKDPTMRALMHGVFHEFKLRHALKRTHDEHNLGKEVQNSTKTLIQFLNRGASTRSEAMPGQ